MPPCCDHGVGNHDAGDAEGRDNACDDHSERPDQSPLGLVSAGLVSAVAYLVGHRTTSLGVRLTLELSDALPTFPENYIIHPALAQLIVSRLAALAFYGRATASSCVPCLVAARKSKPPKSRRWRQR